MPIPSTLAPFFLNPDLRFTFLKERNEEDLGYERTGLVDKIDSLEVLSPFPKFRRQMTAVTQVMMAMRRHETAVREDIKESSLTISTKKLMRYRKPGGVDRRTEEGKRFEDVLIRRWIISSLPNPKQLDNPPQKKNSISN